MSTIETNTITKAINYEPDANMDILTAEDMVKIAECKSNLETLNRKLNNANTQIEDFRKEIKALYLAHCFLLASPKSMEMMNPNVWEQKFSKLISKSESIGMRKRDNNSKKKDLQEQLDEKMADVKEKAMLRDREPNYNTPVINSIKARISELENTNKETNPLSAGEVTFLSKCREYNEYTAEFWRLIGRKKDAIDNNIKSACILVQKLENAIVEDTWLGKYLVYARRHGLNAGSDTIFNDCNRHYLDSHTTGHVFDCPCSVYPNSEDEDDIAVSCGYEHGCGHIWTGGRCSRGTKMYIEYDELLPIGLIEDANPLSYCHLSKALSSSTARLSSNGKTKQRTTTA